MGDKICKIPEHVGIKISGNEKWANERNLPIFEGHSKCFQKIGLAPEWFFERGVKALSFSVFMIEEWNRGREEVNNLMKLIGQLMTEWAAEFNEKEYKIIVSGRIEELPGDLPELCLNAINLTKNNDKGLINFCLNYDGRSEIVDAVRNLIKNGIELEQVHEGMIRKYLYNNELGDLNVVVNFSGEHKNSSFDLWRSAGSEIITFEDYWPEFEESDVDAIINEYGSRIVNTPTCE